MKRTRIVAFTLACLTLSACQPGGIAGKPTNAPTGTSDNQTVTIAGTVCTTKITPSGFEVQVGSGTERYSFTLAASEPEDLILGSVVKIEQGKAGSRLTASELPSGKDIYGDCAWQGPAIEWSLGGESFAQPSAVQICSLQYYNGIIAIGDTRGRTIPVAYRFTQRVLLGHEIPFAMNDASIEPLPKGGPFDVTECYDQTRQV